MNRTLENIRGKLINEKKVDFIYTFEGKYLNFDIIINNVGNYQSFDIIIEEVDSIHQASKFKNPKRNDLDYIIYKECKQTFMEYIQKQLTEQFPNYVLKKYTIINDLRRI